MNYEIIEKPVKKWSDLKPGAVFLLGARACIKLSKQAIVNGMIVDSMVVESGDLFASSQDDGLSRMYGGLAVPSEVKLTVVM